MTRARRFPRCVRPWLAACMLAGSLWSSPALARGWLELNAHGHRIYVREDNAEFALAVSRAIEASARPIAARYAYRPRDTTVWVLHDDVEWFNGAAYTQGNHIELWGTSADFELRGFAPWVDNVVAHEFAHLTTLSLARRTPRWLGGIVLGGIEESDLDRRDPAVTATKFGVSAFIPNDRVPRWFSEGISQLDAERQGGDDWDTTRRMLQRSAWHEQQVMSLAEMGTVANKNFFEGEQVYNQGYSWVRFLDRRFGADSLARLLANSGRFAGGFERALVRTYGQPVTVLEAAWRDEVAAEAQAAIKAGGLGAPQGTTFVSEGPFSRTAAFSWDYVQIAFKNDGDADYPRDRLRVAPVTAPTEASSVASGVADAPAWATDGSFLILARERDLRLPPRETYDLYKVDPDGSDGDWLTKGQRLRWPALHPDGTTLLAAQRGQGTWDLARTSLEDGNTQRLTRLPWGWQIRELAFDAQGRLWGVLIRDDEVDVARFFPDTPNRVELLDWPGSEEHAPRLGPDGRLWFSSDRDGVFQLYAMDPSGSTAHRHTAVIGGALSPAPAVTEVVYTLYSHHRFELYRMPATQPALATLPVTWTTLGLPSAITPPTVTASGFRWARFRLSRPIVYPEFQYLYGEPLGGAILALADERAHHQFQLEILAGRAIDLNAEYAYVALPPRLALSARRYWGNLNVGLRMPYVWDSADAEVLYAPNRDWLIGGSLQGDRIRYEDELSLFQVGGPFDRFRRLGGTALAQWANTPSRKLNDIDPRGLVLYLSATGARSKVEFLTLDEVSSTFLLIPERYIYGRLLGDVSWAPGKDWFTAELGLQVGWTSRDVDPIDEFFLGGNVFNLRRGEFRSYSNLPGYEDFAVSGENLLTARAATRFMLATDMGGAGPLLFDALLLQLAFEGGNAWPYRAGFVDVVKSWGRGNFVADGPRPTDTTLGIAPTDPRFTGLLFDTVADLRLKAVLFDVVPWDSFLRVAYGLQDGVYDPVSGDFDRRGRLPIRIYLGVGTGF